MKRQFHPLRNSCLLTTLAGAVSAFAVLVPTEWRHRQEINVTAPGIIRVELPDATFDAAQAELADLRLLDSAGRELASLLDRPTASPARSVLPTASEVRIQEGLTVLTISTGTNEPLAAVTLETPLPRFLRGVKIEMSDADSAWRVVDEGVPFFRQWGAEQLTLRLGDRSAKRIRLTVSGAPMPVTGMALSLAAGAAPAVVPVGARITRRDEFAGETVLTVELDGRHTPLAAMELETPEPLFMRRVTVAVRDLRDLVVSESTVGAGTIFRVALDGRPTRTQAEVPLKHTPVSRELLVHIQNGDSPPLAISGVRLKRQPVSLLFLAPEAGRYTLLSGNLQAQAPRYDLAAFAGDLRTAPAASVTPGPLQEMPGYQARATLAGSPLPEVPLLGAPLDPQGWARRRSLALTTPGVHELELDSAALAGTRRDFADLRLRRAENQIPFVLERTNLARSLTLFPESVTDAKRPTVSIWRLPLSHPRLPLQRLALASDTLLFQREFRIFEKVTAADGRTYEHTLASGAWNRTPDPESPRTRVFELSDRVQTDTLWLETDNGDNPPIALASVKAEHAVVRIVFKTAETDDYELLYGNERIAAPRYDLGLVANQLLTSARQTARLGAEETVPTGFGGDVLRHLKGGVLFWSALVLVVIVLLAVVVRLLPKAEAPK